MVSYMQARPVIRNRRAKSLLRGSGNPHSLIDSPALSTPLRDGKKKTPSVADVPNGEELLKKLNDNLQARDTHISELNEQIVGLKAVMKLWESQNVATLERQLRALQEEKTKISKEKLRIECEILEITDKFATAQERFSAEKEALEASVTALTAEAVALRQENIEKVHLEAVAKDDLQQLSAILKEMTKMNAGLNDKIAEMNAETEQINKEKYELSLKIQSLDVTEKENELLKSQIAIYEKRFSAGSEDSSRSQSLDSRLSTVTSKLKNLFSTQTDDSIKSPLQEVIGILATLDGKQESTEELVLKLKLSTKEQKSLTAQLESELKVREVQNQRIAYLESEAAKIHNEGSAAQSSLKQKIKELESEVHALNAKNQELTLKVKSLEATVANVTADTESLKSKLAQTKESAQETRRQYEAQRIAVRTLQTDLLQVKSIIHTQEFKSKSKERAFTEMKHKLSALSEEVWKKETEVLRKESIRIRLEEEVRLLHAQNAAIAKTKTTLKSASATVRRPDDLVDISIP